MSKKIYHEVGAVFGLGKGLFIAHKADGKYWVKEPIAPGGECFSCCFRMNRGKGACAKLACCAYERKDQKEVVFEKV